MGQLILSCSLNPNSKSHEMAKTLLGHFHQNHEEAELLCLRDFSLPHCDGESAFEHDVVKTLADKIRDASGITLSSPIYNYDVNAATKTVIELTGKAWSDKIVGFLCAAGGHGSYMAITPMANSLMLDFHCLIIPRFVYATGNAFSDNKLVDTSVLTRIEELAKIHIYLNRHLPNYGNFDLE